MDTLLKLSTASLLAASLVACGGSSSDKEDDNKIGDDLPKIDQSNLDKTTPAGIWLVNVSENSTTDRHEGVDSKVTADFKTMLVIKKQESNLDVSACAFSTRGATTYSNNKFTSSNSETDTDDGVEGLESETSEITFNDNLALVGTAKSINKETRVSDSTVLKNGVSNYSFSGIKVSDATNFANANELTVSMSVSDGDKSVDLNDVDIHCVSVSNFKYEGPSNSGAKVKGSGTNVEVDFGSDGEFDLNTYKFDGESNTNYEADVEIELANGDLEFDCFDDDGDDEVNRCKGTSSTATIKVDDKLISATSTIIKSGPNAVTLNGSVSVKIK